MNVVLLRPVRPLRVSPSWGIVREVALILLRLVRSNVETGADEIFGNAKSGLGIFNGEFRVAGLTTDIEPAISFLLLLGFSTLVMKSPN